MCRTRSEACPRPLGSAEIEKSQDVAVYRAHPATGARRRQAFTDVAELSVIIILALGALATAGWTVARLARVVPAETEDHRLKRALQSAADGLARRQVRLVGGALVVEAAASLAVLGWLHSSFSWWMPLGLAVGTLCTFVLSQLSVGLSLNAASSASRLVTTSDSALVLGLRAGSALMLLSGAIATLLGVGILVGVRMGELAASLAFLEGCLIGGLGTGLMLHMTGSSLRVAGITSRVSAPGASKHPFYCLDSGNPSLVLDLVAQHTGAAQGHVLRVCWAMSLQQVLVLIAAGSNPAYCDALLGTLLLTQSASLVCSGTIQLVLRGNDGVRTWATVLNHGLLANGLLTLVALVGATFWLLGENAKIELLLCALVGAALTWVTVTSSARGSARQNRRLEDHQDNQRRPALDVGFAVPSALQGAATQLAAVCVALLAVAYLVNGSVEGGEQHAVTALLWLSIGAFISLPYIEAQGLLEPLTEATASLAALRMDQGRAEPHAQLGSLCAVGQQAGATSQRWFSINSSLLALLGLGCLSLRSSGPISLVQHGVQGLLAIVLVLGVMGVIMRRVSTTALIGVNEVARHHRTEPDNPGKPGYAQYVETITGHALERGVWVGASLVLVVWMAVAAIANIPGFMTNGRGTPPTTFLAFVATAGISVSLLGVGIASFVGVTRGFRRVAAESGSTPMSDSLNTAQLGLAELAGSSLAPAALVLVHLTIAVVLAVTPVIP